MRREGLKKFLFILAIIKDMIRVDKNVTCNYNNYIGGENIW
ncbi:hypothetical protein EMIT074MI3_20642 [Bacillus licheniformis]